MRKMFILSETLTLIWSKTNHYCDGKVNQIYIEVILYHALFEFYKRLIHALVMYTTTYIQTSPQSPRET